MKNFLKKLFGKPSEEKKPDSPADNPPTEEMEQSGHSSPDDQLAPESEFKHSEKASEHQPTEHEEDHDSADELR